MQGAMPFSGSIEENSLPRLLNYLYDIKSTGTLSLTRETVNKKLYLKGGGITFASSTYDGDRLGELLLKANKINVKQFDDAVKVMKQAGKRMGGVMVELGFLKPKDLFWGVKYQVQEIVCSLFDWTEGSYEFRPDELPAAEVITLHMSTANLILQGVKRIDDWTRISRGIPPMDSVLRVTSNPLKLYQDIDMSDGEKRIISLFDGRRRIKDALDQAGMGDFEALKAVYVFYTVGILEDAAAKGGEAPSAAIPARTDVSVAPVLDKTSIHKAFIDSKSQNYYELLALGSEATVPEVEAAYHRLAKLYHPDQKFRSGMGPLSDELDMLFNKVTEAFSILSDDSRRWEYDLSLATVMSERSGTNVKYAQHKDTAKAKEAFAVGLERLKARDFETATVKFKEAIRLDSGNASYHSHLALTLLQRPRREAEAEEVMLEAIKLEPMNPDHRANLGLLYQKAGMNDKAREAFSEALRLDPKNAKAMKGMGKKM